VAQPLQRIVTVPAHGRRIAVIGLGYVGLPVATALANAGNSVIGFDIDARRIDELRRGHDRTGEVVCEALVTAGIELTVNPEDLQRADFHIVTVPTPITAARLPDLGALRAATRTIGRVLKKGDIVVYESTVYPGATEEDCVPLLEAESGLRFITDFGVGYSPERINPGDPEHRFETIAKVVAGSDAATLAVAAAVYASVVRGEIYLAPSIKVAEAAKVIENTQRDLNIALMNEVAMVCDRLGIQTRDVLAAARTKWNFLPFSPGLVGGHCVGVDPYYLTAKAEAVGYRPEVILAGRRTNDGMGAYVAQKLMKLLARQGHPVRGARVGILGLTFKENVPDIRNSRVPDIIAELREHGIEPLVHDPLADAEEARAECGVELSVMEQIADLHALILAVPHRSYLTQPVVALKSLKNAGIVVDVKSALEPMAIPKSLLYWCL
jgi:UDP-N-acetyl-D-glucosamine/UDP-N-acetyl-D-galactosamine dehydrogenase